MGCFLLPLLFFLCLISWTCVLFTLYQCGYVKGDDVDVVAKNTFASINGKSGRSLNRGVQRAGQQDDGPGGIQRVKLQK